MFTRLRLQNFKCFKDTGDLDIRPLTFLMGPNSSGKSSILQALLMLRQTADSPDVGNPLRLDGPYVSIPYRDLVFGHAYRERLTIDLTVKKRPPGRTIELGRARLSFTVEFGYSVKGMRVYLSRAHYERRSLSDIFADDEKMSPEEYEAASATDLGITMERGAKGRYTVALVEGQNRFETGATALHKFCWPRTLDGTSDSLPVIERLGELSRETYSLLTKHLEALAYIGPLRDWPKRAYVASGETPQDVGLKGEYSADVLWIQSRRKKTREALLGKVNRWARELDMASQVALRRLGQSNYYSIMFTDPKTGLEVNLADVGFGASQVLPVLVEGFYSARDATLLIEQPEIHLHPRAQATLGDLLIDIEKSGKTLIVETHSEHLVGRIQRRIAEGKLSPDKVALYYFEPTPEGTQIKRIGITERGQFEPEGLPEGFFEEAYRESLAHAEAILKDAPR
jgi:predicted ATPase